MRISAHGTDRLCPCWSRDRERLAASSAIAIARRSTFSAPGSFCFRRTAAGLEVARQPGQPAGGLALAAALRRGGRRWAAARQDAQARQGAAPARGGQDPGAALQRAAGAGTHWTGRMVAEAVGVCLRAVQRIWEAHRLQPHRIRTFKKSNDPGLRRQGRGHRRPLHEPARPCRRRLDRREEPDPGARPHPARPAAETRQMRDHDPRLQAQRHHHPVRRPQHPRRHRGRPLHAAATPTRNSSSSSTPSSAPSRPARSSMPSPTTTPPTSIPRSEQWLADHPRWVFHFTPTSASWLNAVEGFFSIITRRRIRRGVFKSVADLQDAIRRYIREHNRSSKPSSGPSPPKPSSPNSAACLYLPE